MTRELYKESIPSIKSLLINGKPDVVYLLIEDDEYLYVQSDKIKVINVADQDYFRSGPNLGAIFTYMAMMRVTLCKYLKESKVLSLDCDVIINGNIDELWNLDIKDYYFAGGKEPDKSLNDLYVNMGVIMYNLDKMRDGMADKVIEALNTKLYGFLEQDALNEYCAGHILEFDSKYNSHRWSVPCEDPVVVHYAGFQHWAYLPLPEKYEKMEV